MQNSRPRKFHLEHNFNAKKTVSFETRFARKPFGIFCVAKMDFNGKRLRSFNVEKFLCRIFDAQCLEQNALVSAFKIHNAFRERKMLRTLWSH